MCFYMMLSLQMSYEVLVSFAIALCSRRKLVRYSRMCCRESKQLPLAEFRYCNYWYNCFAYCS
jgi:hypothetical protein